MTINLNKTDFLIVSVSSVFGATIRWQVDNTFIVNIIGCFLIGLFSSLNIKPSLRLFISFGICGSLTTFSGWILDLFELILNGSYINFFLNILIVFITSFSAVFLGHLFAIKISNLF